jgi:hypothetical protein
MKSTLLNMNIKINNNKKLLFEFISISFAVFLGLMLNQWKDNLNNKHLAKQSINNILLEISLNKAKVEDMLNTHKLLLHRIDSTLTSLDTTNNQGEFSLDLNFQLISSTSWETTKLTQAIVYMDINVVNSIAGVYSFQEYYESIVKEYVVNNIYNLPQEEGDELLRKAKNFLNAIITIEDNLIEYYNYMQKEVLI